MSSSPLPSRIRPSQNQFLSDLTQVFRRHRIPFGHPADIEHLGSYLDSNPAFRSDLFTLCTAISHMSETDLTPEALLHLTARAIMGGQRNESSLEIPDQAAASFFANYHAWVDRDGMELLVGNGEADTGPSWRSSSAPYSTAASLSGGYPGFEKPQHAVPSAAPRSLPPDTPIGSLTLGELKNYLEDIEQRVSRLQPYLDAVSRTPSQPTAPAEPETSLAAGTAVAPIPAAAFTPAEHALEHVPGQAPEHAIDQSVQPQILVAPSPRSRKPSRVLIPAAASVAVVAAAATLGYRSFAHPVPVAPLTSSTSDTGQPAASAASLAPASLPAHLNDPSSQPASPSAPTQPAVRSLPTAAVKSTAGVEAKIKPLLADSDNPVPVLPQVPLMGRALPALPEVHATAAVVPASRPAPSGSSQARKSRVIEPYNQRGAANPSKPTPSPVTVASAAPDAHPGVPTATPAPTARNAPETGVRVSIPSPTMMTYAINTPSPSFPSAYRSLVDSSVLVQANIGKDGRVTEAKAISGVGELGAAAVSATEKWRFRPYMLNGAPVEVVTTIRFVFKAQR